MRMSFLVLSLFLISTFSFATFYEINLSKSGISGVRFSPVISPSGLIFQRDGFLELGFNTESLWIQYSDFLRFTLPVTTQIFKNMASKYGIEYSLLKAIMRVESSFYIHAISKSDARGLMQLKFPTARENNVLNSFSIFQNVEGACKYLSKLYKEFRSWDKAIAAYFVGPAVVRKSGITKQAKGYVKKVKNYWNYYKRTNKDENLRDLIWWGVGVELNRTGIRNLNLNLAIPILGFCEVGIVTIVSKNPALFLNPSFYLTDQLSIGARLDFKNSIEYSMTLCPNAEDYYLFISSDFSNDLAFGILVEKKFYSILFGVDKTGISAGITLKFDFIEFGGGFKKSPNAVIIFKTRNPW